MAGEVFELGTSVAALLRDGTWQVERGAIEDDQNAVDVLVRQAVAVL